MNMCLYILFKIVFRLHAKLEALDYEVEQAAENELFQGGSSVGGDSIGELEGGGSNGDYGNYQQEYQDN